MPANRSALTGLLVVVLLCEAGLALIGLLASSTLAGDDGIGGLVLMGGSGAAGVVLVLLSLLRQPVAYGLAWLRLLAVLLWGAVLFARDDLTPGFAAVLALLDSLIGIVVAGAVRKRHG
ncbi:hypothetical protein [Paractinoplanes lichenicola]|uniref:DUF2568 domain-containing protein n=1 Tax=Paractinoplanes lichenicola TaxID=2802976 RepID=A0ABS1VW88_9ACTN|nr:hypothetical protein [Actinoplanes lichenicola]MBL7258752.1 hypothetical protein [Actinoplanes lichenicola]